ncbi:MAG TPA: DUF559 domain-containing protein, partial [Ktedonobacteraceae bacterium]
CFWHGCPKHLRKPRSNEAYWQPKIESNIKRDNRRRAALRRRGWSVLRIWEHDLKCPEAVVKKIGRVLIQRGWTGNHLFPIEDGLEKHSIMMENSKAH